MKFAIAGAGAIGGFVGAMLARSGEDVTLIARGAHLRAIREHGVRVRGAIGDFEVQLPATDDVESVGTGRCTSAHLKSAQPHRDGSAAGFAYRARDLDRQRTKRHPVVVLLIASGGDWDGTHSGIG